MVNRQDYFISDMFIMDSLRGPDSCGLVAVNAFGEREVNIFKKAVLPHDFINMGGYHSLLKKKNTVLIGHNRWATAGSINAVNAHPFTCGNTTGVHNGTLTHQHMLPDSYEFEVDSENIIHAIDKQGIDRTWKQIRGSAALIWYDKREGTVNFIRNKDRPLYFCYSKDLLQMYAASEKYMLMAALDRNGIDCHPVEELPVDTLYTFKVNKNAKQKEEVVKCKTREVEPFRFFLSHTQGGNYLTGHKMGGQKVDFRVTAIVHQGKYRDIHVKDNENESCEYLIEERTINTWLNLGELATGIVSKVIQGVYFIKPQTIKRNSGYELVEPDKDTSSDMQKSDWDKLHNSDCDWCSSPIDSGDDYLLTTNGELFCTDCKDLKDVRDYVEPCIEGELLSA